MLPTGCRASLDRTVPFGKLRTGSSTSLRAGEGGCPHMRIGDVIKDKRAAQCRRSGNHCGRHKIPRKISGNAGAGCHRRLFAFYSPMKILLRRDWFVKLGKKKALTAKIRKKGRKERKGK